jgi:RNA polymerase sigma-70 factor (ECF subfamily)
LFLLFALLSTGTDEPPDEAEVQKNVSAARRGDRAALARLYRWHVGRISRVVRPFARNEADTEDLVQETFVRAFAALDRYEPRAGARFVSWLCTVARNSATKRQKKLARAVAVAPESFDQQSGPERDAEQELELSVLARALLAVLAEVPERDRWVLCLRYGGELDVAEVALLTGQSPANVRKICERRRAHVLARLGELGYGDSAPDDAAEGA